MVSVRPDSVKHKKFNLLSLPRLLYKCIEDHMATERYTNLISHKWVKRTSEIWKHNKIIAYSKKLIQNRIVPLHGNDKKRRPNKIRKPTTVILGKLTYIKKKHNYLKKYCFSFWDTGFYCFIANYQLWTSMQLQLTWKIHGSVPTSRVLLCSYWHLLY
jgi:hypothetical protein